MNCDEITVKKLNDFMKMAINGQKLELEQMIEIWPQGRKVVNLFKDYIEALNNFTDNLFAWRKFLDQGGDNLQKQSNQRKYQGFVLKNRKLGPRVDELFNKASKSLNDETGINILDTQ